MTAKENKALIEQFYTAFSNGNSIDMAVCYHKDVVFTDPAFGTLKGERAIKMWEMLLSNKKSQASISFKNIEATETTGLAQWTAQYTYGPKKRKVINHVKAHFIFKDGKIIEHTDSFNIWKWSQQALGPVGLLMGWALFMKKKIQKTTNNKLDAFIRRSLQ